MTTQPPGSRNSNRLPREGFFALLAEALLERQLRQAMEREGIEALPMYPEGRPCRRPTARRLIDLFEPIQRHELHQPGQPPPLPPTAACSASLASPQPTTAGDLRPSRKFRDNGIEMCGK